LKNWESKGRKEQQAGNVAARESSMEIWTKPAITKLQPHKTIPRAILRIGWVSNLIRYLRRQIKDHQAQPINKHHV
jgi:hypothetical protein